MVYRFQEFKADPAKGSLLRGGDEIPVRRKAFQVLLHLLEHQDRTVSKDELFAAVWQGTAVTDDVLAGVITELRKALADNPKTPLYIKTVPRLGYRFIGAADRLESAAMEAVQPAIPPATAVAAPIPGTWRRMWPVIALATAGLGWLALQSILGHIRPVDTDLQEVAWWRFDENAGNQILDSSGSGNTGAIHGGVRRVPGKMGMALEFDGNSGYVTGTDSAHALPGNLASRTVTAWIRTTSTNGDFTPLFLFGGTSLPAAFQGHNLGSRYLVGLRMDGKPAQGASIPGLGVAGARRVDDGEWHHVAVNWQGPGESGPAHVYVDGRDEGADMIRGNAIVAGSPWWIGGIPNGSLFRGQVDDLRVFNGALNSRQVSALHRCSARIEDLTIGGEAYYFLPVYDSGAEIVGKGEIRNGSHDFGGVQFSKTEGGTCQLDSLRGTDVGQDLKIALDLLVPSDAAGHTTEAGPYFRSRRAAPGDGLMGGTSAGYSVLLYSSGSVVLQRLNPLAVVAFASIPDFDNTVFHHLEMAAVGEQLQVEVDGRLIEFDQGGRQTRTLAIPPVWNGPPVVGYNRGTAGVGFSARQNRGVIGGQVAKGIRVERTARLLR
jgi:DNA-binding winged helix-turn-helix (wHTH) protein